MALDRILAPDGASVESLLGSSSLPPQANAGLVFDRYLRLWTGPTDLPRVGMLQDPLQRFATDFNQRRAPEAKTWLSEIHSRIDRSCPKGSFETVHYRTAGRLATGLGTDHPSENGFTFDSVLGVPVLAGSGVKGVCRQAAMHTIDDKGKVEELFGPEDLATDPEGGHRGDLVFLDAYPRDWPKIGVDIVNCHYPRYYRSRNPSALTETDSPVPVFFLIVEAGVGFVFRLGSRRGNPDSLNEGVRLLDFALTVLGFGAKTAVGYGVMERDAAGVS